MVVPEEIQYACNMGEVATVAAWLDSGNDPDEATADEDTLLFAAAERGGPDMMRMLIARAPRWTRAMMTLTVVVRHS